MKNKILYLGDHSSVVEFLRDAGYEIVIEDKKLQLDDFLKIDPHYVISYGYRHIIKKNVLDRYSILNLHISYLPWNRGADPNFWSFFDDTLKGVTIHFMDEGIDTGGVIFQTKVAFGPTENTLALTYQRLKDEVEKLFIAEWDNFTNENYIRTPQNKEEGSHHCSKILKGLWNNLPNGWNTTIEEIKCLKEQMMK
jgi:methionyl-tRNA formyltransferase